MDMSAALSERGAENCRHAQVVFDKFHVIMNANKAVDQVRRAEVRLGGAGVWEALHKSQWLWRKNPENLDGARTGAAGRDRTEKSLHRQGVSNAAGAAGHLSQSPTPTVARQRFRVWCRWVRWVARFQPKYTFCAPWSRWRTWSRTIWRASWPTGNGA